MREPVNGCKHQLKTNKTRSFRDLVSQFMCYGLFTSSHFLGRLTRTLNKLFLLGSVEYTGAPKRKFCRYRCGVGTPFFFFFFFCALFFKAKKKMYLSGYASWTFKPQKILGKEILWRELTSCCCLFENANLPFCRTQNDNYISPKTSRISFPISRNFELNDTPVFLHSNRNIAGDNRSSEQIDYSPKWSVECPEYAHYASARRSFINIYFTLQAVCL